MVNSASHPAPLSSGICRVASVVGLIRYCVFDDGPRKSKLLRGVAPGHNSGSERFKAPRKKNHAAEGKPFRGIKTAVLRRASISPGGAPVRIPAGAWTEALPHTARSPRRHTHNKNATFDVVLLPQQQFYTHLARHAKPSCDNFARGSLICQGES